LAEPAIGLSLLQIIGWAMFFITWAFMIGSRVMRRGGSFLFLYLFPLFVLIAFSHKRFFPGRSGSDTLILLIHCFINRETAYMGQIWPRIIQDGGIAGFFLFPLVYLLALREWEKPGR
jgi:hypothetical protein